MSNPIFRGLGSLGRFSGRDRRGHFWPYAGVVVATIFAMSGIGVSAVFGSMFGEAQMFAEAHPEAVHIEQSPGSYSMRIDPTYPGAPMPDFSLFFGVMGATIFLAVVFLAAAVSRRLHDSSRSAYWGLLPLPFIVIGMAGFYGLMSEMMASAEPNIGLFLIMFANNALYMAALVTLIILLCLPSTAGLNRYGEPS